MSYNFFSPFIFCISFFFPLKTYLLESIDKNSKAFICAVKNQ